MAENLREIVNGRLLSQFIDKKVSISGLVTNNNKNSLQFEMRTVDDVTVKVILKKPLSDPIEGHVEVHGVSQGSSVICEELIQFQMDDGAEFDVAGHNTLCILLNSLAGLWNNEYAKD